MSMVWSTCPTRRRHQTSFIQEKRWIQEDLAAALTQCLGGGYCEEEAMLFVL